MKEKSIDEKTILWLDNYDFMSFRKKEQILSLVERPSELLKTDRLFSLKKEMKMILNDEELSILTSQASIRIINDIEKILDNLGIDYITYISPDYPINLKNIDTSPFVLYFKGDVSLLSSNAISVVGSRHITNYGKMTTEKFTKDLVSANFTIISGLASGVDTVAHNVTLACGGKTIAVLAGGLDVIYPPTNVDLSKQIVLNGGLLISEVRPGKKTEPYMFPIRNRIIAALSKGVLITEAQEKSGVIHTKNYAIEYGKDVFAVPGNIFSLSSVGTNRMIVNGQAKAVINIDDILEEYGISFGISTKKAYNLSLEESIIINTLTRGEKSFQELLVATKYETKTLNSLLTTLVIRGLIKKLAGNIYYLNS